ncbi:branched-chain amino acid ABC transporter permease [Rhodococcus sp. RS1C4]|uniref:ABC transporter substrate-binding protein n=1 Tax=Nocardiaceae TaxID=85025 RepID=UPI0003657191|nr:MULTISPECIES: ABC transporter substrate-binding protein [Rhodococcus]OZC53123.1 branched-chain amino acid ABC transporter permease [Rhodococcus sp. RS1C4]OZD15070.1 branched-chain amino acid ABC transporter permease [Rhodococcus sp. 06-156-4C]OZD19846.1 branched-chain amino acid ABC transporter permease [Rhodococcus sp. 06-156-4a]OZD22847.1 branched-chain amino acid ABC transporter permease [Rhodococcus sp. 06-156-3C]OZD25863.1 branched-chain amino acid ABC transporter permease [Rhodococcus
MKFTTGPGRLVLFGLTGAMLSMAACSGSGPSGATASGEMPAEITVLSTTDKTGTLAYVGGSQLEGIELAVQEINEQKFLGDSTLKLDSRDTAGDAQTAASQVTEGIANPNVAAILGTVSGAQSVAVAPIAESSKTPVVFTQSGSAGVVIGDYTFRSTAPQETYFPKAIDHLKTLGAKRISVLYNAGQPTLAEIAENQLPALQESEDLEILSSTSVQSTTQDFASTITKIVGEKPDAVVFLLVGAQNSTAMSQLRQAGFDGPAVGNPAAGAGNLAPAGPAGAGMFWATDFNYLQTAPSSVSFVEAYSAKYGKNPLNYAAEGYDAAWMIARAIKESGGASREDIKNGLDAVATAGFDGAVGPVTFEGNDQRVAGVVVEWDGTAEGLLAE